MQKLLRNLSVLVLAGTLTAGMLALYPSPSSAGERLASVEAISCPTLQLKHWQASTRQEKLAFLFGFATMLEIEKEWQAGAPLPVTSSIAPAWVRGLSGRTLGDICTALDAYTAQNPDKLEQSVAATLGRLFVAPKMTPAERNQAKLHYQVIKADR